MNQEIINLIVSRVEELGYKIGGEAVSLIQQYYPLVRRKILISNVVSLTICFVVMILVYFLITKVGQIEKENSGDMVVTIVFSIFVIIIDLAMIIVSSIRLLNLDYYTINEIIGRLQDGFLG
ncbi:MAG: hypothetical protein ACQEQF_00230 [Bacillota bacterium]